MNLTKAVKLLAKQRRYYERDYPDQLVHVYAGGSISDGRMELVNVGTRENARRVLAAAGFVSGRNPDQWRAERLNPAGGSTGTANLLRLALPYLEHPDVVKLPFAISSRLIARKARFALRMSQPKAQADSLKLALRYLEHPDVGRLPFALSPQQLARRIRTALGMPQANPAGMKEIDSGFYRISDQLAARLAKASPTKRLPRLGYELRQVTLPDGRTAALTRTPYRFRTDAPKRGWVWAVYHLEAKANPSSRPVRYVKLDAGRVRQLERIAARKLPAGALRRHLEAPERHQLRVAQQTLKMPAPMLGVMGGPTVAEAKAIVQRLVKNNPARLERAARRRGILRYRTIGRGRRRVTCAVVRKRGPRGGRTVCWPRETPARSNPGPVHLRVNDPRYTRQLRRTSLGYLARKTNGHVGPTTLLMMYRNSAAGRAIKILFPEFGPEEHRKAAALFAQAYNHLTARNRAYLKTHGREPGMRQGKILATDLYERAQLHWLASGRRKPPRISNGPFVAYGTLTLP